ncbi:MAG: hypothetical protein RIC16_16480 [Rhodospirillales bacterium]
MFDDTFLFAALADAPLERRVLLLSVRRADEFGLFQRAGWRVAINGLMAAEAVDLGALDIDFPEWPPAPGSVAMVLGDLAAFTPDHIALIGRDRPAVVKANFVSSPIDGGAFLLPESGDRMLEAAAALAETLHGSGYACWVSTWYRNDVMPHMWKLDASPDLLTARLGAAFPFNLIGFREPALGERMETLSETFKHQRSLFDPFRDSYP